MDPFTTGLAIVAMLVLGITGYSIGHDRGRNAGRMEVLKDWWSAEHPEPVEPEDSLAWLLDIDPGSSYPGRSSAAD